MDSFTTFIIKSELTSTNINLKLFQTCVTFVIFVYVEEKMER